MPTAENRLKYLNLIQIKKQSNSFSFERFQEAFSQNNVVAIMRRTSSDLTSQQSIQKQIQSNYALQLTHNTSKTYTVSNLKDWRLQFEKGQNLTVDTNTDTKLFDNASTVSPCSPSDSLSSTDEGFTYEFDPNDQFLGDLNSPKEQRLRSSSITDVGGGTHLHSIVLANNTIQMRNILKPLLDQDSPESKDNSYKEQLLTMLSTSDRTGSTPLFLCKSAVMCDLLLNAGANPNHRSKGGLTPLHRSSLFARVDVVCRLIGRFKKFLEP